MIGLALARRFPGTSVIGIDKCEKAVALSNENAKLLGLKDSAYVAVCASAVEFSIKPDLKFDAVISNPPYIPSNDMLSLSKDVIDFEDYDALCGGDDGLSVVREIITKLPKWLKPDGLGCWMEVDPSHPVLIQDLLNNQEKVRFVEYRKDFCERDRFVKLQVTNV